jgi:hypothetical protein
MLPELMVGMPSGLEALLRICETIREFIGGKSGVMPSGISRVVDHSGRLGG